MAMVHTLATLLEKPLVVREPLRELDAIVVLGAPLAPGDRLSPVLEERIAAAVALYRAGGAKRVIATGGVTNGASRAEADVIAETLAARGVANVVAETASQTTAENARFVAELLPPGSSAWLVTQPFHARRAVRLFRARGIDAHGWHIDDSLEYRDRRRAVKWLAREYAAWVRLLVLRR